MHSAARSIKLGIRLSHESTRFRTLCCKYSIGCVSRVTCRSSTWTCRAANTGRLPVKTNTLVFVSSDGKSGFCCVTENADFSPSKRRSSLSLLLAFSSPAPVCLSLRSSHRLPHRKRVSSEDRTFRGTAARERSDQPKSSASNFGHWIDFSCGAPHCQLWRPSPLSKRRPTGRSQFAGEAGSKDQVRSLLLGPQQIDRLIRTFARISRFDVSKRLGFASPKEKMEGLLGSFCRQPLPESCSLRRRNDERGR